MAYSDIGRGLAPNDGLGDDIRSGAQKINDNFALVPASQFFSYGGTANAITLTSANTGPQAGYVTGAQYRFRAAASNTGPASVNIDGLGVKTIKTVTGADLPTGYIRTDVDTVITYNGSVFVADRHVEYGTNSNGNFTRFSNGFQFCTISKTIIASINFASGSIFRSITSALSGTYPAAFKNGSDVYQSGQVVSDGSTDANDFNSWIGQDDQMLSSISYRTALLSSTSKTSVTLNVRLTATGVWY